MRREGADRYLTAASVDDRTRECYPCAQPILGDETLKPQELILSRKGFDSGSGGCPSPIFPDGTMFSLPIPSYDEETFEDLQHGDVAIADVVTGITNGRMSGLDLVHLDPDLNFDAYRHRKDRPDWQQWRGMLGQAGRRRRRRREPAAGMRPGAAAQRRRLGNEGGARCGLPVVHCVLIRVSIATAARSLWLV